jgi:predicted amidohydrolase
MSVLVGIWNYPSQSKYGTPLEDVAAAIAKRIDLCAQEARAQNLKGDLQAIFLAPEYLFTGKKSATVDREPMDETQKQLILQHLLVQSKQHPNVLIIPGTIFYSEPLFWRDDKGKVKPTPMKHQFHKDLVQAELRAAMGNLEAKKTSFGPGNVKELLYGKDKISGKNLKTPFRGVTHGRVFSPKYAHKTVPSFYEMSKADDERMRRARNRTFLLLNGERKALYDKHADFKEAEGRSPDRLAFVPGTSEQCPRVGGFRFGVEICFDHANATLKRRKVADLDFHVVLSDCVGNDTAAMAMKDGGYFLHASSAGDDPQFGSSVYRRTGAKISKLNPGKAVDDMRFWLVPSPS